MSWSQIEVRRRPSVRMPLQGYRFMTVARQLGVTFRPTLPAMPKSNRPVDSGTLDKQTHRTPQSTGANGASGAAKGRSWLQALSPIGGKAKSLPPARTRFLRRTHCGNASYSIGDRSRRCLLLAEPLKAARPAGPSASSHLGRQSTRSAWPKWPLGSDSRPGSSEEWTSHAPLRLPP